MSSRIDVMRETVSERDSVGEVGTRPLDGWVNNIVKVSETSAIHMIG